MCPIGDGDDDVYDPTPPPPDKNPCAISFTTGLTGPDPQLVAKLHAYSVLQVGIVLAPLRGRTVEVPVAKLDDVAVGTIDDVQADDLLRCIKAGNRYRAVVQRIDGGHVVVRIEPLS